MDTYSYEYIYDFPGGYPSVHKHQHKDCKLQESYEVETSKCVDILDKFGNPRYQVQLSSALEGSRRGFQTSVTQIICNTEGSSLSTFLVIPENGYEYDYNKAMHDFKTCVQRYDSLVKAEMKDFRDIEVYAEKIDYEVTSPECCGSCRWSRCKKHGSWNAKKLECYCPDVQRDFSYAQSVPPLPGSPHPHLHGWQKLPWQENVPDFSSPCCDQPALDPIFPTVDYMGRCKFYARKGCKPQHEIDDAENPPPQHS